MSKQSFIAAHEALVEEYLDANPKVDWETAYDRTADAAHARMCDDLADRADALRQSRNVRQPDYARLGLDDPEGRN